MKKGQVIEGVIEQIEFPNKGMIVTEEGKKVIVKNGVPGQRVSVLIHKIRKGKCEGRILEILERSALELKEPGCPHAGVCGGCTYQTLPYQEQLVLKEEQVKRLLDDVILPEHGGYEFLGIKESPRQCGYRNKMEFSFGDECKDGPLALGMHKRGSFYDIVNVPECQIVDKDFRTVLKVTLSYFHGRGISYYHKLRHTGYLRHLLVRKAVKTGEILIDLITTTQLGEIEGLHGLETENLQMSEAVGMQLSEKILLEGWREALLAEVYEGKITGILHTKNDSVADVVKNEGTEVLFGQDFFYEELLGLRFRITPFSFFQTNSLGAEVLYETARAFMNDGLGEGKVVFDLYSGTGTIAQMLAPVAKKMIGVEIVPEAVEAARENAKENDLRNCEFIAGDVLKVIDEISERPDYIVLDPPRDGVHPKALEKIIQYGVDQMVYISCKPTSLVRDLEVLQARGYVVKQVCCVDMFPGTVHCEVVTLLQRIEN